ncbi:MAG: protein kinase [Planctomycetes bacterium]|nr:protein kinase [Planctomycetota bacterium]
MTDPALTDLIRRALELGEQGETVDLDALTAGRPELREALATALQLAPRLADLQRRARDAQGEAPVVLGGRYRLEHPIGAGAMGTVHRAVDLSLERPVALKILHRDLFDGPQAVERFAREALVLAQLSHPNVVTVFDRGEDASGASFLVMELLEGASLATLLADASERTDGDPRRLTETRWVGELLGGPAPRETNHLRLLVSWCADLAAGLHAAHLAGVYHRDVKPSNVLIRRDGVPVLLDFGIAARNAHGTISNATQVLGTPAYMAPEQASRSPSSGPALDVYGLSATLYHMVTLRSPYSGTPVEVIHALSHQDPVPAARLHPGVPRDLQAILDKGMERDPRRRYATAADLEADLRAFLAHQPVRARPLGLLTRSVRTMRRSRELRAAAIVLLLLALGGAWWLVRERQRAADLASWQQHWQSIPPSLGLVDFGVRRITDPERLAATTALLDDCVRLRPDELEGRVLRAAFRLDHQQPRGAADDMEHVAEVEDTPYLTALAARYRALPPDAADHRALRLDDLPEPTTPADRYVAGYHVLRGRPSPAAMPALRDLLQVGADAGHEPCLELLAPVVAAIANYDKLTGNGRYLEQFELAARLADRLETKRGFHTAWTRHTYAAALLGAERYAEALQPLRDAVTLYPTGAGQWANLGVAYRNLRYPEWAQVCLAEALRLQPGHPLAAHNLVQVLADLRLFDDAEALDRQIPAGNGALARIRAAWRTGYLFRERATVAESEAERRRLADLARDAFQQASDLGEPTAGHEVLKATAIANGDGLLLARGISAGLAGDPVNWRAIESLAQALSSESTTTPELADFLFALSARLKPAPDAAPLPPPSTRNLAPR